MGRSGRTKKIIELPGAAAEAVIFPGGVPGESADFEPLPASPRTRFRGNGRVRASVDGSEANVCLHWKDDGGPTGGYSGPHGPASRLSEEGTPRIEHHYPAQRQLEGDSRHMGGNEGSDSRNRPES